MGAIGIKLRIPIMTTEHIPLQFNEIFASGFGCLIKATNAISLNKLPGKAMGSVDKSIYFDRTLNASPNSSRSIIKVSVFICEQIHNVNVSLPREPFLSRATWKTILSENEKAPENPFIIEKCLPISEWLFFDHLVDVAPLPAHFISIITDNIH